MWRISGAKKLKRDIAVGFVRFPVNRFGQYMDVDGCSRFMLFLTRAESRRGSDSFDLNTGHPAHSRDRQL